MAVGTPGLPRALAAVPHRPLLVIPSSTGLEAAGLFQGCQGVPRPCPKPHPADAEGRAR